MVKSDEVKGPHVDHVKCSKCFRADFHLRGRIKYLALELFNLPMFIIKRQYEFRCSCGHSQCPCVKPKQLKILKRQMLPLSYFVSKNVGVFVLMLVMGLSYYAYQAYLHAQQQAQQAILTAPQVNDFFFIDYYRFDQKSHPKISLYIAKSNSRGK